MTENKKATEKGAGGWGKHLASRARIGPGQQQHTNGALRQRGRERATRTLEPTPPAAGDTSNGFFVSPKNKNTCYPSYACKKGKNLTVFVRL